MTDLTDMPFDDLTEEEQESAARIQRDRDRICGHVDMFGGPCVLPKEGHPERVRKGRVTLIHDDGRPTR